MSNNCPKCGRKVCGHVVAAQAKEIAALELAALHLASCFQFRHGPQNLEHPDVIGMADMYKERAREELAKEEKGG